MSALSTHRRTLVLASLAAALAILACGDEETGPRGQFPSNPGPVTFEAGQRALPLELNRSTVANRVKYETYRDAVSALFVYAQIYSEYVEATEGATGRPDLDDRVDDIYEEFADELAAIPTHYLIVDLQRRDREWIVDWEGLSRDEPDNRASLDFSRRDDYWPDVQQRIVNAVQRTAPTGLIIGAEMNRYYEQNPTDWPNFVAFYWSTVDAVKAVDSSVRISAGINWAFLMETQVGAFSGSGGSSADVPAFERAYETIVEPLVVRFDGEGQPIGSSDFVGLSFIPDPTLHSGSPQNLPEHYFGALRQALPDRPIVWFQIGWPIRSAGSSAPADFYARFQELAGGLNHERVSWWGLSHLLSGDCTPLTGTIVGAPETICLRGMFSDSGAGTALSGLYLPAE